MDDGLRTPPQAIDAEVCVVGSMLISPERLQEAICEVRVDWFFRPVHRMMFDTLCQMASAGTVVDAVTFRQALRDAGEYERCGGDDYLQDIVSGVPDALHMTYYARTLKDKYLKRQQITLATKMLDEGYDSSVSGEEALGNAYAGLQAISEGQRDEGGVPLEDAIDDALGHAKLVADGEVAPGLATGFVRLDREILHGGFRDSETVVVAADTSVGKTVVGCDFARNFCHLRQGVIIASAEMPARELTYRLLAAEANVTINTIRSGRYTTEQSERMQAAREEMKEWRLHILEGNRTIADIAAAAKRINAKWDGRLAAVIIDYLQIMIPEDGRVNRELQVGTMALRCKQAANQMKIPWIMMSQFNRGHQVQRQPPTMSNLRDSGQIEQHANIIILLHPTNGRKMESGTPAEGLGYYEIGMFVPKNRNGMTHSNWNEAIIRKVRRFCGRTEA